MKCPKCQHENEQGDKFCRECGERLPSVCPQCGNSVKPGDRFCAKCGASLLKDESALSKATIPKLEDMHSQLQSLIPEELAQKYATAEPQAAGENWYRCGWRTSLWKILSRWEYTLSVLKLQPHRHVLSISRYTGMTDTYLVELSPWRML